MKTKYLSLNKIYTGAMLGMCLLASCEEKDLTLNMPENQLVTSIDLEVSPELPLLLGVDSTIVAHALPEDAADRNLKWTSSNSLVASVSDDGTISALSLGSAVITVTPAVGFGTDETVKSISVSVLSQIVGAESIVFTNPETTLYETDKLQLTYQILPEDHTYSYLTWSSSDENIATVDKDGVVTGVHAGEVDITAYTHDKTGTVGTIHLTVKELLPATDISIAPCTEPLYWKQKLPLNFTLTPKDATNSSVEWTSSDESILTVTDGVVQAVGFGTASVTATCSATGKQATVDLTVASGYYVWDYSTEFEGWAINSNLGSFELIDGKMEATVTADTNQRIYLQRAYSTQKNLMDFNFKNYPVIAFRCDELNGGSYSINLANLGNTLNDAGTMKIQKLGDGTQVVYYDASKHASLSADGIVPVRAFMFKLTKIPASTFTIFWIRTFKSVEEMNEFVKSDNIVK